MPVRFFFWSQTHVVYRARVTAQASASWVAGSLLLGIYFWGFCLCTAARMTVFLCLLSSTNWPVQCQLLRANVFVECSEPKVSFCVQETDGVCTGSAVCFS